VFVVVRGGNAGSEDWVEWIEEDRSCGTTSAGETNFGEIDVRGGVGRIIRTSMVPNHELILSKFTTG
jgi:hypothetical protein